MSNNIDPYRREQSMAKKKKKWLKIAIPVAVVLIIAGIYYANMAKKRDQATEVTVEKVARGKLVQTVAGTGRMQPEIQVKISANVSGRIMELHVKEGDRVAKGDFLVRLNRDRYEAAVEQAQSGLKSSEAALIKSKSELTRIKELNQRGMAAEADLEAAQAQNQLNSAEVERAQAYLKQAKDDLAKTSISSPMDGIVSQVNKEVGEIALGAQFSEDVILTVADLNKMEVLVEVDENDIVDVKLDDTARVKIDAFPDTVFKGKVREIAHTGTTRGMGTPEELTNFQVKIAMLEVPQHLRPGMSATADIITKVHEDAVHVPIQSVVMREPVSAKKPGKEKKEGGKSSEAKADTLAPKDSLAGKPMEKPKPLEVVFMLKNGVVKQIPIKTGISSDVDIEVLSGLAEGDSVVTGPFRTLSQKLQDGEKVKVKKGGPESGFQASGQENRSDGH
jgi:HlyD family secretion protein